MYVYVYAYGERERKKDEGAEEAGKKERKRERKFILRNWLTRLCRLGKSKICRTGQQAGDTEKNWYCRLSPKADCRQNFLCLRESHSSFC